MPLAVELETFPLHLAKWIAAADPVHDLPRWLPYARISALVFWWMLLGATYVGAGFWGGSQAARLAVALVACEPILLGHASLATTDMAFTASLLSLVVIFHLSRDNPSLLKRSFLCGLAVALTLLSKASGLVYIPVCLMALEAERLWSSGWRPGLSAAVWVRVVRSAGELILIGCLGMVLLLAFCPRALGAFTYQVHHQLEGHDLVFLLGAASPTGFWYYFPLALLIKLSLPVVGLVILVSVCRPGYCFNAPLLSAAALLVLSTTFRVQIGVRFVLPIAVLGIIGGSVAFIRWRMENMRTPMGPFGLGRFAWGLLLWSAVNAWVVWPNGICHTNELWGGTKNGYLALSDSNYDWGQGLKELAAWQRNHNQSPLNVWYFGKDPLLAEMPMQPVTLAEALTSQEVQEVNRGRFLAVSTSLLYGCGFLDPAARYLREIQPCGRTTTFLIYDFTKER